jgi:subfamily B ATP-binding cassette protein MsbA
MSSVETRSAVATDAVEGPRQPALGRRLVLLVGARLRNLLQSTAALRDPAYRLLLRSIWHNKRQLTTVLTCSLLTAVFEGLTFGLLAVTLQILVATDSGQTAAEVVARFPSWLAPLLEGWSLGSLFAVSVLAGAVCQILRALMSIRATVSSTLLAAIVQKQVQLVVYQEIMRLSFACASRFRVGNLTNYVINPSIQVGLMLNMGVTTLATAFMIVAYVLILSALSLPLFLATLILFGPLAWAQKRLLSRIQTYGQQVAHATADLSRRLVETIQNLRVIHALQAHRLAITQMEKTQDDVIGSTLRLTRRMSYVSPLSESIIMLGIGGFLVLGYFMFQSSRAEFVPQLVTFVAVLNRLSVRVSNIGVTASSVISYLGQYAIVNEVLRPEGKTYLRQGGTRLTGLKNAIEFDRVSLCYASRPAPALQSLSFRIPRGTTTALVGPSGAGKSSVADLLLGLYEPTQGRILIDGLDLAHIDLGSWRARIGVVSQDTMLFNASVKENIRFGCPTASDEEIVQAAHAAHAAEFIEPLPDGYDTVIGERGFILSGGQRQRLALARALLRRPELLILDEATSALDSHSEKLIQATLESYHHAATQVVIAHRLSTIRSADQILVLNDGCIVESGTHQELLARQGMYAKLWESQTRQSASAEGGAMEPESSVIASPGLLSDPQGTA